MLLLVRDDHTKLILKTELIKQVNKVVFSAYAVPFICVWGGGNPGHLNLNQLTPSTGSVSVYELCPTVSSWYFTNVQVSYLYFSLTDFSPCTPHLSERKIPAALNFKI